jgi:hypothetical protein
MTAEGTDLAWLARQAAGSWERFAETPFWKLRRSGHRWGLPDPFVRTTVDDRFHVDAYGEGLEICARWQLPLTETDLDELSDLLLSLPTDMPQLWPLAMTVGCLTEEGSIEDDPDAWRVKGVLNVLRRKPDEDGTYLPFCDFRRLRSGWSDELEVTVREFHNFRYISYPPGPHYFPAGGELISEPGLASASATVRARRAVASACLARTTPIELSSLADELLADPVIEGPLVSWLREAKECCVRLGNRRARLRYELAALLRRASGTVWEPTFDERARILGSPSYARWMLRELPLVHPELPAVQAACAIAARLTGVPVPVGASTEPNPTTILDPYLRKAYEQACQDLGFLESGLVSQYEIDDGLGRVIGDLLSSVRETLWPSDR